MSIFKHSNHTKLNCEIVGAKVGFPVVVIMAACWLPYSHLWPSEPDCSLKLGCYGQSLLIAQRDQSGDDPHGPDPHGPDPHDEQHDKYLPANKAEDERKAPTDPYGGEENRNREAQRNESQGQRNQPLL